MTAYLIIGLLVGFDIAKIWLFSKVLGADVPGVGASSVTADYNAEARRGDLRELLGTARNLIQAQ